MFNLMNFSDIENDSDLHQENLLLSFPEKQLSNFSEFRNKKLSFDEDSIQDLFEYKKNTQIQIEKKNKQKQIQKIITKKLGICDFTLYLTQLKEKQTEIYECMRTKEIQQINGTLQVVFDFESKLNEAQFYNFRKKTHVFQVKISNGRLIRAQLIKICQVFTNTRTKNKRGRKRKMPLIKQIIALQNQSNQEETKKVVKGDLLDELSTNKRHKAYLAPRLTAKYFPSLTGRPSTRRLSKPISQEYLMTQNKLKNNKIKQQNHTETTQNQQQHQQQQEQQNSQQQEQQQQKVHENEQLQQQQVQEQNFNKPIHIDQEEIIDQPLLIQQHNLEAQELLHLSQNDKLSPLIQQQEEEFLEQQFFDFQNFTNEFNQQQDLCDADDELNNDFYLNYDNGQDKYQNDNQINDNEFIQNDQEQKQQQFDENIYFQNQEMISHSNQELNNGNTNERQQNNHNNSDKQSSISNRPQKNRRSKATHKNNLILFELGQQNDLELSDYVKLVQEYEDEVSQEKQDQTQPQEDEPKQQKNQSNISQQNENDIQLNVLQLDHQKNKVNLDNDILNDEQIDDQMKETERPKQKQTQQFLEIQEIPLSFSEPSIKKLSQESQSLLIQLNDTNTESENQFELQLSFDFNDELKPKKAVDTSTIKMINQSKSIQQKPKPASQLHPKRSQKKKPKSKNRSKVYNNGNSRTKKQIYPPKKAPATRQQRQNEKKEIVVITIDDSSDDESLKEDQRVTRNRKSKQKVSIFEEWGEKKISKQSKLQKKQEMIIQKTKFEIREKLRKQERRSK